MGATASGKSRLAIDLAEQLGYEIYSTDSRQCYKGLEIGTAAPTADDLAKIKHYNVGVMQANQKESAAYFLARLEADIPDWKNLATNKNLPFIFVGGSTLQAQTLLFGLDASPPANADNLQLLQDELDRHGPEVLMQRLQHVDPEYAQRMDGFNRQRCFRALDVWMQSGKAFSSFHTQENKAPIMPVFALKIDRKKLHERINQRVLQMWDGGLLDEYKRVLGSGISPQAHALQSVGYAECAALLAGQVTETQAIERIQARTRQYAKRQETWLKRWPFVHWISAGAEAAAKIIDTLEVQAKHH
jgi:tRNA dimethylallyltransferase